MTVGVETGELSSRMGRVVGLREASKEGGGALIPAPLPLKARPVVEGVVGPTLW